MGYAKSEETKKKLLKTTMRLLRTQGFNATGISQILTESGVPKGSLYHHFPSGKTELTLAAVKLANKSINRRLEHVQETTSSSEEAVHLYFGYYIAEMTEGNYDKGCPIATVTLETATTIEPIQMACKATYDSMHEMVKVFLLQDGLSTDEANRLALTILAGFQGALVLCKAQQSTLPLEIVRDNMIQQIRAAIEA